jgi:endonuclease G
MRKKSNFYTIFPVAVITIAALLFVAFEKLDGGVLPDVQQPNTPAANLPYELPRLNNHQSEQVIEHLGYTVSYNHKWLIPNWVAYELTATETNGAQERSNHFKPDPLVKGDPVTTSDYSKSGYDRGHMAPAADMKWSEQAMRESFYMTNICPQIHNLNAGDWKDLEELARDWAQQYGNIYIACGPIIEANYQTIGKNHSIAVPSAFYKVFLRQTRKGWTSIGFIMPNKAGNRPLMTYMLTVDEIEEQTGIDFFYNLPDSIESQVESIYSISDWSLPRH